MPKQITNKDKKFKFIEESNIRVLVKIGEEKDENGNTIRNVGSWQKIDKPTSLGSLSNPNKEILSVKVHIPSKEERENPSPFKRLFRG